MPSIPTDLAILNSIYERYYATFAAYSPDAKGRSAKIYVPLDIKALAVQFGVDQDIIFGRLYYHLEKKHGYKDADGSLVPFFALRVGGDSHCVNFPYMASVLADLRSENRKYRITATIAVVGFLFSIYNFIVARMR